VSMEERSKDAMSNRRSLLTGDDRKEFDQFYGKPKSDRRRTGAGKGDQPRDYDAELYALGWESAFATTFAARRAASEEWKRVHDEKVASNAQGSQ